MKNPILVTGAAGFIGFHTARRLLERGEAVTGIDNLNDYYDVSLKEARLAELQKFPQFKFVKLDIADRAGLESLWENGGPFTRVIHLAAQAGVRYSLLKPEAYVMSNCAGHLNILEMCRHTDGFRHLVYASSSSVYGANAKLPFSVRDAVDHPVSFYAATKRSGELMSESYARLYALPQTGLRFFTVYGPWGRPDMALFSFTKAMLAGEAIAVFNNGDMKRDFTYIDDIVDGVVAALDHPPPHEKNAAHVILNLGNTRSEKLMDFIRLIERDLHVKALIEFKSMQDGDVYETFADISETTARLGYRPKTAIEEGVPQFIAWYKSYYGEKAS